ncbi:hypothetical protein THAOC_29405, partial [Thalassiosira oceanica]
VQQSGARSQLGRAQAGTGLRYSYSYSYSYSHRRDRVGTTDATTPARGQERQSNNRSTPTDAIRSGGIEAEETAEKMSGTRRTSSRAKAQTIFYTEATEADGLGGESSSEESDAEMDEEEEEEEEEEPVRRKSSRSTKFRACLKDAPEASLTSCGPSRTRNERRRPAGAAAAARKQAEHAGGGRLGRGRRRRQPAEAEDSQGRRQVARQAAREAPHVQGPRRERERL